MKGKFAAVYKTLLGTRVSGLSEAETIDEVKEKSGAMNVLDKMRDSPLPFPFSAELSQRGEKIEMHATVSAARGDQTERYLAEINSLPSSNFHLAQLSTPKHPFFNGQV